MYAFHIQWFYVGSCSTISHSTFSFTFSQSTFSFTFSHSTFSFTFSQSTFSFTFSHSTFSFTFSQSTFSHSMFRHPTFSWWINVSTLCFFFSPIQLSHRFYFYGVTYFEVDQMSRKQMFRPSPASWTGAASHTFVSDHWSVLSSRDNQPAEGCVGAHQCHWTGAASSDNQPDFGRALAYEVLYSNCNVARSVPIIKTLFLGKLRVWGWLHS